MQDKGKKIAEFLLSVEAFRFRPHEPFRWSSGWRSPVYCDNRILLSYPDIRNYLADEFARLVRQVFPGAQAIAGVATAGIAHGVLAADRLSMPFAYVRPQPKAHGTGRQIEGRLQPNEPVVVIEDLISTGKSSLQAIEALRAAGIEVLGTLAIFSYGFNQATLAFEQAGVQLETLTTMTVLMQQAEKMNYLSAEQFELIRQWQKAPQNWRNT